MFRVVYDTLLHHDVSACVFLHVVQAAELTSEEKEVMESNILRNA